MLVVLSNEALEQYQTDVEAMRRPGVDLLFATSGEDGLDKLGAVDPQLVIVGEIFDLMEGLEFLALTASRYPDFKGRVVVLPDRDDPVVPMCHYKDHATGRSITEEISMDGIMALVDSLAASTPVASASTSQGGVVPFPAATGPSPGAPSTADLVHAEPITDAPRNRVPMFIIAGVVAAAVAGVLAFMVATGDEPDDASKDRGTAPSGAAESKSADDASAPEAPGDAPDAEVADEDDGDEPTVEDDETPPEPEPEPMVPEPGEDIDTAQATVLPLDFAQDGHGYTIRDPVELDRILGAFKRGLADNPDKKIEVGGHTSSEGAEWINESIGEKRADAVRRDLVSRGIPADRIVIRSYGASKPKKKGRGIKNRKVNRRVTLRLIE